MLERLHFVLGGRVGGGTIIIVVIIIIIITRARLNRQQKRRKAHPHKMARRNFSQLERR